VKIVIVTASFSEKMGYCESMLAQQFALDGNKVHVISGNIKPYFNMPGYEKTYGQFIGPPIVDCGDFQIGKYVLHRLPHMKLFRRIYIKGLLKNLREIRPDVVQDFTVVSWHAAVLSLGHWLYGYRLFLGNHHTMSVSPWATEKSVKAVLKRLFIYLSAYPLGRLISHSAEKCYAATPDCRELAIRFMGVPDSKCELAPLGSDTKVFHPCRSESDFQERKKLREKFEFSEGDVVCIYTGRLSEMKNPLLLAKAIDALAKEGLSYKGLFVGAGPPELHHAISDCRNCIIIDFIPFYELPNYYRAADIGVWPRQESTSMIDAAATALPLVVSHRIVDTSRLHGAIQYSEDDIQSLINALISLKDPDYRRILGQKGASYVDGNLSWTLLAKHRLKDYELSLKNLF